MPAPDAMDEAFTQAASQVLAHSVELIRQLIGAHQAAAAGLVKNDWRYSTKGNSVRPIKGSLSVLPNRYR